MKTNQMFRPAASAVSGVTCAVRQHPSTWLRLTWIKLGSTRLVTKLHQELVSRACSFRVLQSTDGWRIVGGAARGGLGLAGGGSAM